MGGEDARCARYRHIDTCEGGSAVANRNCGIVAVGNGVDRSGAEGCRAGIYDRHRLRSFTIGDVSRGTYGRPYGCGIGILPRSGRGRTESVEELVPEQRPERFAEGDVAE